MAVQFYHLTCLSQVMIQRSLPWNSTCAVSRMICWRKVENLWRMARIPSRALKTASYISYAAFEGVAGACMVGPLYVDQSGWNSYVWSHSLMPLLALLLSCHCDEAALAGQNLPLALQLLLAPHWTLPTSAHAAILTVSCCPIEYPSWTKQALCLTPEFDKAAARTAAISCLLLSVVAHAVCCINSLPMPVATC